MLTPPAGPSTTVVKTDMQHLQHALFNHMSEYLLPMFTGCPWEAPGEFLRLCKDKFTRPSIPAEEWSSNAAAQFHESAKDWWYSTGVYEILGRGHTRDHPQTPAPTAAPTYVLINQQWGGGLHLLNLHGGSQYEGDLQMVCGALSLPPWRTLPGIRPLPPWRTPFATCPKDALAVVRYTVIPSPQPPAPTTLHHNPPQHQGIHGQASMGGEGRCGQWQEKQSPPMPIQHGDSLPLASVEPLYACLLGGGYHGNWPPSPLHDNINITSLRRHVAASHEGLLSISVSIDSRLRAVLIDTLVTENFIASHPVPAHQVVPKPGLLRLATWGLLTETRGRATITIQLRDLVTTATALVVEGLQEEVILGQLWLGEQDTHIEESKERLHVGTGCLVTCCFEIP
ncbi:hypothetical protein PR048_012827 [Dryococelus australis]|uniref:Uncharacterized protein n=1 Tax=Dryococelus australis TaxID=614101 RepID=A0ABQ9HR43_9NEOP|nr:hypothetical protein PR048_012827 [Dryococelus australis]